jgi:thiamine biosynthesis lipoprotein
LTTSTSLPAFGSTAVVVASDDDRLGDAVKAVERTIDAFDRACSRFRDDSELQVCNRAGGRAVHVSGLLLEAIGAGLRAAELTDGDVDPALGDALIALGYDDDWPTVASRVSAPERKISFARVPGWRAIRIDHEAGTVALAQGVSLDLGATAKALAADHAAEEAFQATGSGTLVSFGGDLATAGPAPEEGWSVRVTDDHRAPVSAPGQSITIRSGGLATSSTTARRWRSSSGEVVHHVLDPATRLPAHGGWRTVSVAAATCVDANIASTAAIVRGQRAPTWLRSLGLPSRLVSDEGLALHVAGWPEDGDDLEPLRSGAVA